MSVDATVQDTRLTAQGHRQTALENAGMAEFVFSARSDSALAFVKELTALTLDHESAKSPRDRARQKAWQATFQGSVGAFAADLILHHQNLTSEGFAYRPVDKDMMGQTLVSVRSFEQLCDLWPDMDLLEFTSFIRVKDAFEEGDALKAVFGRTSRYRAMPKLLAIAARFGIEPTNVKDNFDKEIGRIDTVQVRGEKFYINWQRPQPVRLKMSGPRYDAETNRVKEINSYLATGNFDLTESPWVFRTFNRGHLSGFNYNQGGRLTARSADNWQNRSSTDRARITCNGELTVELDVRASHMFILYALFPTFTAPQGDHYSIAGVERDVVKALITSLFGLGKAPRRWPKVFNAKYAMRGEILSDKYKLGQVMGLIYAMHPVLGEIKKEVMDWGRLQYEESECFVEAMLDLGRSHRIAALPVHDSLIVAQRHAELAEKAIRAAYQSRFGRMPEIKLSKAVLS